jgi:hypothetical protein
MRIGESISFVRHRLTCLILTADCYRIPESGLLYSIVSDPGGIVHSTSSPLSGALLHLCLPRRSRTNLKAQVNDALQFAVSRLSSAEPPSGISGDDVVSLVSKNSRGDMTRLDLASVVLAEA